MLADSELLLLACGHRYCLPCLLPSMCWFDASSSSSSSSSVCSCPACLEPALSMCIGGDGERRRLLGFVELRLLLLTYGAMYWRRPEPPMSKAATLTRMKTDMAAAAAATAAEEDEGEFDWLWKELLGVVSDELGQLGRMVEEFVNANYDWICSIAPAK